MNKFWFLSFADSRLKGPLRRMRRQSKQMRVFKDNIRVLSEGDLDADFRDRMAAHLIPGTRGYGYWCWKPQVILQVFREMNEGDVLLYCDAGCSLNPRGIKRLNEYFNLAREHGIVLFQSRALGEDRKDNLAYHILPERCWTKGDMLDYFDVRNDDAIIQTGQYGGTVMLFRKDAASVEFVQGWADVFAHHFELCDDSPSHSPNLPDFIENRHDQSAISILGKKRGVFTLSSSEYILTSKHAPKAQQHLHDVWPSRWKDLRRYPIWGKQDKGGFRSLFPIWFKNIVHRITNGRI